MTSRCRCGLGQTALRQKTDRELSQLAAAAPDLTGLGLFQRLSGRPRAADWGQSALRRNGPRVVSTRSGWENEYRMDSFQRWSFQIKAALTGEVLRIGGNPRSRRTEKRNQAGLATGLNCFQELFVPAIMPCGSCAASAMCSPQTAAAAMHPRSSSWVQEPGSKLSLHKSASGNCHSHPTS